MTNFVGLAKKRYSCRNYLDIPVEEEKLLTVLEAARIAPSAANQQPWIFYIIRNKENINNISTTYHREWLKNASIIIVACADHSKSWKRSDGKDYADIDLAIAIDHLMLQATELDLATCWICNFDSIKCSEILKLPQNIEPLAIIPLAYPADIADTNRHSQFRKPLKEIIKKEL